MGLGDKGGAHMTLVSRANKLSKLYSLVDKAGIVFCRAICARVATRTSSQPHLLLARFAPLKRLGATYVFDYSSSTAVADILSKVREIGQGPITHALDA